MSFDNSVVAQLKKVLGWDNYQDASVIAPFGTPLNDTESGEYYQDYSGALSLEYILACLPPHSTLSDQDKLEAYCDKVEDQAITQVLAKVQRKKNIGNNGKNLASSEVVFEVGKKTVTLTNQSYFCGIMFEVGQSAGLRATINRIGLYLTASVTDLDLYLFHSSQEAVVSQFTITTTTTNSFSWSVEKVILDYDNGAGTTGGTWYLGYYQSDLATASSAAIQYSSHNWLTGYCNTCNGNYIKADSAYKTIRNRLFMTGFFVQGSNLPVSKTERFDPTTVIRTDCNNWGFNLQISITCNLTQFWIENRSTLKDVIGLQVAMKVLEMMKYSSQINNIEENVKVMIIRDLEGAKDTNNPPLNQQLDEAIEDLILDEGNLGSDCFPCARKPHTSIGAIG